MNKAWRQSRYDKPGPSGETDAYVNCPMSEEQYLAFLKAMNEAPKTEFKEWEKDTPYFEGCLPVEVMASRGPDTLRYGPLKPVGLTNAHQPDIKPHAIVQLRQDNKLGYALEHCRFSNENDLWRAKRCIANDTRT